MAITINWGTKVIYVPKVDMTLIQELPTEIRELNLNTFRLALKDLEDSEAGMPFLDTHRHNTEVSVAGITLSRVIEIINGYTVTFEDGQYAVNLPGANSNVGDVVNVNQVSVRTFNSAGLISVSTGSGLSTEEHDQLMLVGEIIQQLKDETFGRWVVDIIENTMTLYKSNGDVLKVFDLTTTDETVPVFIERIPR